METKYQDKLNGFGTRPLFEGVMSFYIRMNVMTLEHKGCSIQKMQLDVPKRHHTDTHQNNRIEIDGKSYSHISYLRLHIIKNCFVNNKEDISNSLQGNQSR